MEIQEQATSFQIRLDTSNILKQIEAFLKGERVVIESEYEQNTGQIRQTESIYKIGEKLANDKGIQNIVFFLTTIFNQHTVQGNITNESRYDELVGQTREDLALSIMLNLCNWEIKEENYHFIIDTIMIMIKTFLSRTLFNKERESYIQTVKQVDTTTIRDQDSNKFKIPFMGGRK